MLSLALALPAVAADYDLVILNGRVIDPETMLDAAMNVGVKDGTIAIITKDTITGTETIDATGLVVAPGLIDTHFHSLDGLSMKMAAGQWPTTETAPAPTSCSRPNERRHATGEYPGPTCGPTATLRPRLKARSASTRCLPKPSP